MVKYTIDSTLDGPTDFDITAEQTLRVADPPDVAARHGQRRVDQRPVRAPVAPVVEEVVDQQVHRDPQDHPRGDRQPLGDRVPVVLDGARQAVEDHDRQEAPQQRADPEAAGVVDLVVEQVDLAPAVAVDRRARRAPARPGGRASCAAARS